MVENNGVEGEVSLKDVIDIIESDNNYRIPSYQRGYRWTDKQVEELLDDIWNWGENEQNSGKYCLQPIVIKKNDNGFDLIDGQQRLTTLYIILKVLGKEPGFTLNYENRDNSEKFLKKINEYFESMDEINPTKLKYIDFFYFLKTCKVVHEYFEDKEKEKEKEKWYDYLKKGAFFIEYNATKDKRSPEDIFTNLNAGKITLKDSELVKGLFLKKSTFENGDEYLNKRLEIALDWDRIERRLQDEDFWAWLGNDPISEPRIEFIFNIVGKKLMIKSHKKDNTYSDFSEYLKTHKIEDLWFEIKKCFMTIEDWYDDRKTRYYVGFLTLNEGNKNSKKNNLISDYYIKYINNSNFSFEEKISEKFENIDIENINYGKNSSEIRQCLLLFNILTCLNNGINFDFSRYKNIKFDIEHIYPHSDSERIKNYNEKKKWYDAIEKDGRYDKLLEEYKEYSENQLKEKLFNDNEKFGELIERANDFMQKKGKKVENIDGIGNLCLLDSNTNRDYGNTPFPCKVKKITEYDIKNENGNYILPATKNVFLKYYSDVSVDNSVWSQEDSENYKKKIEEKIEPFIKSQKETK